jgi:hypothetical protein
MSDPGLSCRSTVIAPVSSTLSDGTFEGDLVVMIIPPMVGRQVGLTFGSRLGEDVGVNDGAVVVGRLVEPEGRLKIGLLVGSSVGATAPLSTGGFV